MEIIPQCYKCKHFKQFHLCDAFADIPIDILLNKIDHRKPYPGDHGILFEAEKQ